MVINSLMIFLFMVMFILIPFFGKLVFIRTASLIVKRVMSLGWIMVSFWGRSDTVFWSRLSTSISMEHS